MDWDQFGIALIRSTWDYLDASEHFLIVFGEMGTLRKLFVENQWQTVILKSAIGLAASNSYRIPFNQLENTLARIKTDHAHSEYLLQPFIEEIISEGEWSFIYFNDQLSHVLLKKAAPGDYRVQGIYGGTIQVVEPEANDLLRAVSVLDTLPPDLLYARLDFVRVNGQLSVMEVELIEPISSFNLVPESIIRLVHETRIKFESQQ